MKNMIDNIKNNNNNNQDDNTNNEKFYEIKINNEDIIKVIYKDDLYKLKTKEFCEILDIEFDNIEEIIKDTNLELSKNKKYIWFDNSEDFNDIDIDDETNVIIKKFVKKLDKYID